MSPGVATVPTSQRVSVSGLLVIGAQLPRWRWSKPYPPCVTLTRVSRAVVTASSRTASVRAAKRSASSINRPRGSGRLNITAADITPMIVITTMSSINVKPFSAERREEVKPFLAERPKVVKPCWALRLLPVADVRIVSLASLSTVGA